MWGVLVVLAVFCIAFGLACPWFIANLVEPAGEALLEQGEYVTRVLGSL